MEEGENEIERKRGYKERGIERDGEKKLRRKRKRLCVYERERRNERVEIE